MKDKILSIIVPVYKAEKFLIRCTDSILKQTFSNIELILVDDGSPDHCPELCEKIAHKDHRVKVVHQKNSGVSVARNTGLKIATGDYITFVDSDDFIEPDMYEKMLKKAEEYQCDIVMCDCVKDNGTTAVPYTHEIRPGFYDYEQLKEEYYPHLLMMEDVEYPATISNCLLVFKRELSINIRYLEGVRFSEDLLFGAQLMYQARSFYYMKGESYYHYWMNMESATHTFAPDKWKDYLKLYQEIRNYFGSILEFDFRSQIDLALLFFVYNAVGDISRTNELEKIQKRNMMLSILRAKEVKSMFQRIKIFQLPISNKLKVVTLMYKYHMIRLFRY